MAKVTHEAGVLLREELFPVPPPPNVMAEVVWSEDEHYEVNELITTYPFLD